MEEKVFTEFTPENYPEREALFKAGVEALQKKFHVVIGAEPAVTTIGTLAGVAKIFEAVDPPRPLQGG